MAAVSIGRRRLATPPYDQTEGEPVIWTPRSLPLPRISKRCDLNNSSSIFLPYIVQCRVLFWGVGGNKTVAYVNIMLTDMTPTASQLYGAQIPAMSMNVKAAVSTLSVQTTPTEHPN
ncbi:hypothetical protein Zmor_026226 [Zophobas morio]|uniref:Uncharacterized protein n=1 Tax=Zophobas morio TaxID=2755281 RepID=A0AA38M4D2_9CUCU|nr:hypothetical protein Zmor_026226 [Zophobas morio]